MEDKISLRCAGSGPTHNCGNQHQFSERNCSPAFCSPCFKFALWRTRWRGKVEILRNEVIAKLQTRTFSNQALQFCDRFVRLTNITLFVSYKVQYMIAKLQTTLCGKKLQKYDSGFVLLKVISENMLGLGFLSWTPYTHIMTNICTTFCKFEEDDKTLPISSLEFALSLAGTLCHVGQFCAPFERCLFCRDFWHTGLFGHIFSGREGFLWNL